MDFKKVIKKKFWKGDREKPRAETVGELIKILEELPKDLEISPYENGVKVTVYNISSNVHVVVEDNWSD